MEVITLTEWVAQKVKVSLASFHRLKVAPLDQKQWTVPPLNHTSTNLWVAIRKAAQIFGTVQVVHFESS